MAVGMFVVFEGIDGSGKSTQIGHVANAVRDWDKYQEVVMIREPTWKCKKAITMLAIETDPMSNAKMMSELFIEDRRVHFMDTLEMI